MPPPDSELNLLEQHKHLVPIVCRRFLVGAHANFNLAKDDLYQEGMMALFRAVKTFDPTAGAQFQTYATRCIHNRLVDILRKNASRGEAPSELGENQAVTDITPEAEFNTLEKSALVTRVLDECTEIERAVFKSAARGHSYAEISKIFDIPTKKIDNTIQKIRNKIKAAVND
jgi:RNA polymerase sporulation-specific sigma factor